MLTPAEAEKLIQAALPPAGTEDCPLAEAHGRVLHRGIRADRDLPPFDRVTMDGYALRSEALAEGTRTFQVIGLQAAGMIPRKLGARADACVEIMTGAVRPEGADCVVPYEDTSRDGATLTVKEEAARRISAGFAIHRRGSDHAVTDLIVPAGTRLGGREIAVAAACGCETLAVAARPRIAVVATGDELVEPGMPVAPHQVRRSNDYGLRAALVTAGYPGVERFHLRDVREEIEHRLWHILAEFDVVLLTGGVSKGKFDYLPAVLEALQVKKVFHGIAQRPGKPMWFGVTARRTPVFAFPGNPAAAYTCLHRYVLPELARAAGATATAPRRVALAEAVTFRFPLAYFLPVRLETDAPGTTRARPDPLNTSGDFAGLVGTDGFVELPAAPDEFPAGYAAVFRPWI
jgi:molybdopterin molybdotransferase